MKCAAIRPVGAFFSELDRDVNCATSSNGSGRVAFDQNPVEFLNPMRHRAG